MAKSAVFSLARLGNRDSAQQLRLDSAKIYATNILLKSAESNGTTRPTHLLNARHDLDLIISKSI
jgi:hypothetical protein